MYKAVGHCRVSKGDTNEIKNSLASQKSEILKLSKRFELKEDEIRWFIEEEARSSYQDRADWEKFDEIIEFACTTKGIKYFFSYNQERFCRNKDKSVFYKKALRKRKIQIRYVSGDIEDPDSIEGFMLESTNEMNAELYSRKIGLDTLRGCKENAQTRDPKTGYTYKNGGSAPFWLKAKKVAIGKDSFGEDIKKTIWVENDTVHTAKINGKLISKTLYEWGRYYFIELRLNRKLGIDRARDILNELEIPAPRGKYWTSTCLYEAEKNESLIGVGIYNKRKYARQGGGREKDKAQWIIVENAHPALLTKEEFEALKQLRTAKKKKNGSVTKYQSNKEHLLSGYSDRFTCASCGGKIISSGDVYVCGKYNVNGTKGCGSSSFSVNAEWLENKVVDEIIKLFDEENLEQFYFDALKIMKKNNSQKLDIEKVKRDIKAKETAQYNLIKSLSMMSDCPVLASKQITKEIEELAKKVQELNDELVKATQQKNLKPPTLKEFKKHMATTKLLFTGSDMNKKQEILWIFVKSITLNPIEREVTLTLYKNPFFMFMEDLKNAKNKVEGVFTPSTKMVAGAGFEPTTFGL